MRKLPAFTRTDWRNVRGLTDEALVRVTEVNSLRILMFILIGENLFCGIGK